MFSRPWPYGAVIKVNAKFLIKFMGSASYHIQARRRMMVITDDTHIVRAVALVNEYDNEEVHEPAPEYWERDDEA